MMRLKRACPQLEPAKHLLPEWENQVPGCSYVLLCGSGLRGTAGTRFCADMAFWILSVIQVRTTLGWRPLSIYTILARLRFAAPSTPRLARSFRHASSRIRRYQVPGAVTGLRLSTIALTVSWEMLGRKTTRQLHVPPFPGTLALYAFASSAPLDVRSW